MSHKTVENVSKMLSWLQLLSTLRTIGLFCCDEQRAVVEFIIFFSSWLSKANESSKKKDPTDNNSITKRAPGHYEQENSFILYKSDDLQSRIADLKSEENLKKDFKRDSITINKQGPTYLLPEFEIILDNGLAFTIKVYEWLLPEVHET